MITPTLRTSLAGLALAALFAPDADAQKLYGFDGTNGFVHEFTTSPGGPCPSPTPYLLSWPYTVPATCSTGVVPGITPPPGPQSFGDVATDSLGDTVFITDGFLIEQYAEYSPATATAAGTPINVFPAPLVGPVAGPLTGLGMDEAGVFAGIPVLWMTDGFLIWGMAAPPAGSCAPGPVVVPPFVSPFGAPGRLTDVTFDPSTASLLLCDSAGFIHSVLPGGAPGPYGFFPVAFVAPCGPTPFLEGIAMDLATTPSAFGTIPAFYVTDGFVVAYLDVTGAPAAPTFYSPVTCTPTPKPLNGLAYVNHSISFGAVPGPASLGAYGQPSTPGPTYGVTVTTPAPAFLWLATSANLGGPFTGTFCPPLTAVGNPLYVDVFTPPGMVTPIGPIGAGTTILPSPIPGALPIGVEVYIQAFLDFTPFGPGGPWLSTNAIDLVVTAP